ncbi:MAG: D-alanine--D-alanine ligase [Dehalococcoidales bacterium]|nr:D-alanine--D-alanine ligase [Dehalococcoidales bacterium]
MQIGLAYDLKDTIISDTNDPDDAFEEYDSRETIEIISRALEAKGHTVSRLGGGKDFIDNILKSKVDIVFNISEGRGTYRSRESQVPAILEMLDIPYTGSDPQCLSICLDKPVVKKLVTSAGVSTPAWLVISSDEELSRILWGNFSFPAIVKPAYEGSSKGIRADSLVYNKEQAVEIAHKLLQVYHQPVMVEQFISGDEITTGIIGNFPPVVLGSMRIKPRKNDVPFVYSLEVKRDWENLVDYECPALLKQRILHKIADFSLKVFKMFGCRDFARVDFRISPEGEPYFLEINPLPGLGNYSDLVIMAVKLGWTQEQLIGTVLDVALGRYLQRICA